MRDVWLNTAGLLLVAAIIVSIVADIIIDRRQVTRYNCITTTYNEVICFQSDGTMFRPEHRNFDKFIIEVSK